MLHLTRKVGQRIVIDEDIIVEVLEVTGRHVKLGIVAPDCEVWREEVHQAKQGSDLRV